MLDRAEVGFRWKPPAAEPLPERSNASEARPQLVDHEDTGFLIRAAAHYRCDLTRSCYFISRRVYFRLLLL